MENSKENVSKGLSTSTTVIVISFILGFFYLLSVIIGQSGKEKAKEMELLQRQECSKEAKSNAQELLRKRMDLDTYTESQKESYKELLDKDMFRRDDYDTYYSRCLSEYGLEEYSGN